MKKYNKRPLIVGIAGGSGSGKSFVTSRLREALPSVAVLELDHYYHCQSNLLPEDRQRVNYDEPAAIDHQLLVSHLNMLKQGHSIDRPNYSFQNHCRLSEATRIDLAPILIVEGILALHWEPLRTTYDLAVFLDCPEELRLSRRTARDMRERGRTMNSVLQQWKASVEPMHRRYVESSKKYADCIVESNEVSTIVSKIQDIIPT